MENGVPVVSVIVPVYRTEAYLPRCLDSLLAQDFRDFELIAVNDGSPDNSGAILEDYAARDERVRVIRQENGGLSAARNSGIKAARGRYLAFVDSDDWVEKSFLSVLYAALTEEDADVASCGYVNDEGEKHRIYTTESRLVFGPEEGLRRMCYNDGYYVTTWDKLYKRELFDGICFPVGKLFEDTATTYLLTDRANRIAVDPAVCYHYVTNPGSITTGKWNPGKLDYIEAAEGMAGYIETRYPELKPACDRKRLHAAFSTLMQLVNSGTRDKQVEKDLISRIRRVQKDVFFDPRAPGRDKAAILSLAFGFPAFSCAWKFYRRFVK